jgi:hypothetical protein
LISIPILSEKHRKDSMKLALAAKAHNLRNWQWQSDLFVLRSLFIFRGNLTLNETFSNVDASSRKLFSDKFRTLFVGHEVVSLKRNTTKAETTTGICRQLNQSYTKLSRLAKRTLGLK